jgi:hypothetical protein
MLDDIWHTLYLTHLQARVVLSEIRRIGLTREIEWPSTEPERREQALLERDQVMVEWARVMTELSDIEAMPEESTIPLPESN